MSTVYDVLENNYRDNYKRLYDIIGRKPETSLAASSDYNIVTVDDIDTWYTVKSYVMSTNVMIFIGLFIFILVSLSYLHLPFGLITYVDEETETIKVNIKKLFIYSFIISLFIFLPFRFYRRS